MHIGAKAFVSLRSCIFFSSLSVESESIGLSYRPIYILHSIMDRIERLEVYKVILYI